MAAVVGTVVGALAAADSAPAADGSPAHDVTPQPTSTARSEPGGGHAGRSPATGGATSADTIGRDATGIVWYDDYHAALDAAQASGRWALLWFDARETPATERAEPHEIFSCAEVLARVREDCVCVRLDCEAVVPSGGQQVRLLAHPAFAELRQLPGLALVDMRDEASPFFRQVVSVWPLCRPLTPQVLLAMLDLPPGTLTQRTLLLALHLDADRPASTSGHWSWTLSCQAAAHARHQAALGVQGHHDWPRRFEAINAELPAGLVAREVCAESWPGQDLWEAAQECVRSWRLSEGHWEIVSSRPVLFGYDMQRSEQGIWYAAGLVAAPP